MSTKLPDKVTHKIYHPSYFSCYLCTESGGKSPNWLSKHRWRARQMSGTRVGGRLRGARKKGSQVLGKHLGHTLARDCSVTQIDRQIDGHNWRETRTGQIHQATITDDLYMCLEWKLGSYQCRNMTVGLDSVWQKCTVPMGKKEAQEPEVSCPCPGRLIQLD